MAPLFSDCKVTKCTVMMASQEAFQGHARGMTIPVLCPPSQALQEAPDQPQKLDFWWEPGPLY